MTDIMLPTTGDTQNTFAEEIARLGGEVCDTYDDGHRLFLRATLPKTGEVVPGDSVKQGIAVRTCDNMLVVHPYVFRKVCSNGAIWATLCGSFVVERVDFAASQERVEAVTEHFRDAIAACAGGQGFRTALNEMRAAVNVPGNIDELLNLIPLLAGLRSSMSGELVAQILDRFSSGRSHSMFDLMNAVTSVARDTRDPEVRWRLEELGGGVPALVRPVPKPSDTAVEPELEKAQV